MRSRAHRSGVLDRCSIPAFICFSNYSSPIPAWEAEFTKTEVFEIEKLKQFCARNYEYLQPIPPESCPLQISPSIKLVVFLSLGLSICLSAHTSSPNSDLDNVLSLKNSNSGRFSAAIAQEMLHPIQLEVPQKVENSLIKSAFAATSQDKSKTVGIDKHIPKFRIPVEGFPITSPFGNRVHPIYGGERFHKGIDIGTPNGTPVKASQDGYVAFADWDTGYGNKVIINHGDGYETLYAHLNELFVKAGDRVSKEEVIGLSGSTGYVTGPHLHFEILQNEVAHNPLDYF